MRFRLVLAALAFAALSAPCVAETAAPTLPNMDFEAGAIGQPPPHWGFNAFAPGVVVKAIISAEQPESGKASALLEVAPAVQGQPGGTLTRSVDATPYRGGAVRFRAAIRTDSAEAAAPVLWLRVDRGEASTDFAVSPTASNGDWRFYDVVLPVREEATRVVFGLRMLGPGKAWIDSASLTAVPLTSLGYEPARALSDRGLANLEVFTRLLGYVRFFHPSDQAADADWSSVAIAGVQRVEAARDPDELAAALREVFAPLAPTLRIYPTGTTPPSASDALSAHDATLVEWRHRGVGLTPPQSKGYSPYSSERVEVADAKPSLLPLDLGGGVSAILPISLYKDGAGTLPHSSARPPAPHKPSGFNPSGWDRATRLADVALAWTVFQHFYPYFDVVHADWPGELRTALRRAAIDRDDLQFQVTLEEMVAALKDGHGYVDHHQPPIVLPVRWDWIDGKLVVTAVEPGHADGLALGDVVETIGGRSVSDAMAQIAPRISAATPQWKRERTLQELTHLAGAQSVAIGVVKPDGRQATVSVSPVFARSTADFPQEARPAAVAELRPGVVYVNLNQVTADQIKESLDRLARARAVVLDDRQYPTAGAGDLLTHLSPRFLRGARSEVPVTTRPDRRDVSWDASGSWTVDPQAPTISGKLLLLIGPDTVSYGESWAGLFETERLGPILGETTAGTNGNINPFSLPGDYVVRWTGMRVRKQDGSPHHGVGIHPTVPVERTIAGVRAGRDEVLERALAIADGTKG